MRSLLSSSRKMSVLCACSLFLSSRTVFFASVAGLGFAWSCSGDVCQQPSKWPHHFCWPHPAELLVGSQRFCGHTICHNFCPYSEAEQVWPLNFFFWQNWNCLLFIGILNYHPFTSHLFLDTILTYCAQQIVFLFNHINRRQICSVCCLSIYDILILQALV